jgi:hypothetical protein
MTGSFTDRVPAADRAAKVASDGAELAAELRGRLEREGLACEGVFADDDGWCFFVSAQSCPVGVTLYRTNDGESCSWQVSVVYEGGLSTIWSEQSARQGTTLAARIRALLDDHLRGTVGRPSSPSAPSR